MVHPSALTSKTTHSLINIGEAIRDLIFREYNKDAKPGKVSYRDVGMPPMKEKLFGQPDVLPSLPAVAIEISTAKFEDAPQKAGSDNSVEFKIILYGRGVTRKTQQKEAIQMAVAVRHIIRDNPTVPTKEGVNQVFSLGYGEMGFEFDRLVQNFESATVGVEVAIITALAVYAETGF